MGDHDPLGILTKNPQSQTKNGSGDPLGILKKKETTTEDLYSGQRPSSYPLPSGSEKQKSSFAPQLNLGEEPKTEAPNTVYNNASNFILQDLQKHPSILKDVPYPEVFKKQIIQGDGNINIQRYRNQRLSEFDGQQKDLMSKVTDEMFGIWPDKTKVNDYLKQIKNVEAQKEEFDSNAKELNDVQAVTQTPLPTDPKDETEYFREIGRKVNKFTNPVDIANQEKHIKDGTNAGRDKELVDEENFNNEQDGIEAKKKQLSVSLGNGEITPEQYKVQMAGTSLAENKLFINNPGAKSIIERNILSKIIDDKRQKWHGVAGRSFTGGSLFGDLIKYTPSDNEVKDAIKTAREQGYSINADEEKKLIADKEKIPGTSAIGSLYSASISDILLSANRFNPFQTPQQKESTEYEEKARLQPTQRQTEGVLGYVNKTSNIVGTVLKWARLGKFLGSAANVALGSTVGAETVGGVDEALGGVKKLTEAQQGFAGTALTSGLVVYPEAKEEAKKFTTDESKQDFYAGTMTLLNTLAFTSLDPEGIIKKIVGGGESGFGKELLKEVNKAGGIEKLEPETFKETLVNAGKKVLGANASAATIMTLLNVSEQATDVMFDKKPSFDFNETKKTAIDAFISFAPISLAQGVVGEIGDRNKRNTFIQAVDFASKDPIAFKESMDNAVKEGRISQKDANEKIRVVNEHAVLKAKADLPPHLSDENKAIYADNLRRELNIKNSMKDVDDEVQTKTKEDEIKRLQQERKDILNPPVLSDEEKVIQPYRDKTGVTKDVVSDDELLKTVALQAQNLGINPETGKVEKQSIANPKDYENAVSEAGGSLVDLSTKKYPAKELLGEPKPETNRIEPISGEDLKGKKIYSDFNSTIADKENKLLPFGEEIKQRINDGEPVTIVTKSKDAEGEPEGSNKKRMLDALGLKEQPPNLEIKEGVTPNEKAELAKEGVLIDNSPSVKDAAEKSGTEFINANKYNKETEAEPQKDLGSTIPLEVEGKDENKIPEKNIGKYESKAREIADKINKTELPKWLVNTDPTIQKSGIGADDLKRYLADATILVGKALDKGIELADAIKEGAQNLIDDYTKGLGAARLKPDFEKQLRDGFENYYKENAPVEEKKETPPEPPKEVVPEPESEEPKNSTNIRKANQIEIQKVADRYNTKQTKKWVTTLKNGLKKISDAHPDKTLYDAAVSTLNQINNNHYGELTRDEAAGVLLYLKHEASKKRSALKEQLNSPDMEVRMAALVEEEPIKDIYENAALKASEITSEAGTTLSFTRADLFDDENGLQLIRNNLIRASGGEKLSPEDEKWSAERWEEQKAINQKIQEAREASLEENFDKKLADLKKEYEDKLKNKKGTSTNTDKADKILKGNKKREKDEEADLIFQSAKRDMVAMRVAKDVKDGKSIDDSVDQIAKEGIIKPENVEKAKAYFKELAGEKEHPTPEETLQKIKDYIKEGGETDVTKEMVGKNLIKDFVDSHIGEVDQKDILDKAAKDLKEILPDVDKKKLIEAYLKEGDYKQDTKKDLEGSLAEQKKQLQSIAKLEEDIADLKGYSDTRQRSSPTEREKSEYEQKLADEKAVIIKENKDRRNKILEDNRKLETERNRQLKIVSDLKDKKSKLEQGIVEKKERLVRSTDTPEIEGLREDVKDLEKGIREAEAAQRAAERKIERDRNSGIKRDNKMLETERNRQLQKVHDLTDKKEKLEKGIRDKKEKIPAKPDTPEIEDLKKQVSEVDKQLREGESRAKEIDRKAQANADKKAELDANIKRAEAGQDIIKTFRNKSDKEVDDELESKTRQLKKAINDNTPEDKVQENLLKKAKENAIRKTKEFQRRIDEGDYEEREPKVLNKSDAELIKLQKEQSKVEGQFRAKQDELRQANKSNWEVLGDFTRSGFVAYWLRKPVTLGKILIATMVRPSVEIVTRKAFIPLMDKFFPGIAKAALGGGESSSTRSMMLGIKAYFNQLEPKGIERLAAKSEAKFQKANKEYEDYKTNVVDNLKRVNASQKEIDYAENKLKKLKKVRDERMFNTLGNLMYQFIGGSSIKDALLAFVHRTNEIEKQFGTIHSEGVKGEDMISQDDSFKEIGRKLLNQIKYGDTKTDFKDYNPTTSLGKELFLNAIDEIDYILGFIGRSHSAAKTFSGRYSFAAGFMARIEGAYQKGEELNASRVLEIGHEAYFDWNHGKYQQKNELSDNWNKWLNNMAKGNTISGKIFKGFLGTEVAIQRVPLNMLWEELSEFTLGAFTSVYKASKETKNIKNDLQIEGFLKNSNEFKDALKERLAELDTKEAATIVRSFRKGVFGLGLYALVATLVGVKFGIFPHLGQKKKKPEEDLKPDELNPGQVMFGNTKLGETASLLIEHQPALFPMFFGSGLMQSYHDEIKKGETTPQAAANAFHLHMNILIGDVPQATLVQPIKERTLDPAINKGIKAAFGEKHQGFTKEDEKDPTFKTYFDKGIEFTPFNPSTVEIPIHKDGKIVKEKLSNLPQEDWDKYNTDKKEVLKDELDKLHKEKIYVDSDGKASTEKKRGYTRTQFEDLTKDQLKELIKPLEASATIKAKNKFMKEQFAQ